MTETPASPVATSDGADPSMEDILASIRRILNEEETPAEADAPDAVTEDDDVLVLDQSMMVSASEAALDEPEPEPEPERPAARIAAPVEQAEPLATKPEPPHQEMEAPVPGHSEPPEAPVPSGDLMAPETAAAATSSVGNLVRTLAAGRSVQVYSGGPTLEDIVRAELRPLLKEWLDTNLPPIVERLVRTEIERVVGRAVP